MDLQKMVQKLDATITVRDMIELLGGSIRSYPVLGDTLTLNGKRSVMRDIRPEGNIDIAYEWAGDCVDNQSLCRIYIGHKHSGPMLCLSNASCGKWEWRNLYSNDNFGKNIACGGTWSGSSSRTYPSALDALAGRDYQVHPIICKKAWTESQKLIQEVIDFCRKFED